jgi:hypothetical protein
VYLLLILWGPVPSLRTWLGVIVLGALLAVGFESFRRLTLAELENGGAVEAPAPASPAPG